MKPFYKDKYHTNIVRYLSTV